MIRFCHQIIHYDLGRNYYKNKAQYDWDRETAKAFALSSENLSKYKLLTDTEVLPEEYLLEKPGALKRF